MTETRMSGYRLRVDNVVGGNRKLPGKETTY